jgi:Putative capsular polysaccharide synthesis protein
MKLKNLLQLIEIKLTKFLSGILKVLGIKEFFKSLMKYTSISYWKNRNTLFLIYTMGKVGGTSITHTIQEKLKYSNVFHIHYLSSFWLGVAWDWDKSENNHWIRQANRVKPYLKTAKKIKIITIIRDPISVHISGEFENSIEFGDELINTEVQRIIDFIKKKGFDYPTRWFKDELLNLLNMGVCDLDVFSGKGYTTLNKDNKDVLILKFESLNDIAPIAISEFLGIKVGFISSRNRTQNKSTNKLYEEVNSAFSLREKELEIIYNQPILQLAYSEKELEEFKSRWMD